MSASSEPLAPVGLELHRPASSRTAGAAGPLRGTDSALDDVQFVRLVRWVFTARLVCLALAAPSAVMGPQSTWTTVLGVSALTVFSFTFSRSDRLVRTLLLHPLLASVDVALTVLLLVNVRAGQPAVLTVISSALIAGLLFPRRVLVVLMVPLVIGSLGAPAVVVGETSVTWQGLLGLVAGVPALAVGVCTIGAVVRRSVDDLVTARHEVAAAVAAVGAADERARLAREMHDSVGKSLYGISLGAKALGRAVASDTRLATQIAGSLAQAADQAAVEARTLLLALRADTDDRTTIEMVSDTAREWQDASGVTARVSTVETVDAAPEVTREMQAALREILHNVDKHARADEVEIVLSGGVDIIELLVHDDGVGFDLGRRRAGEAAGHFGLRGLQERAAQVGGDASIDSTPGKGTTVRWTAQRQPHPR